MTAPSATHNPTASASVASWSTRERVDHALQHFLDERAALFADPPQLRAVFDLTSTFVLRGGKRLRPLFCYWGWRGAGGAGNDQAVITAAASLEIFHAFTLIHDDIMDASDTRRGHPTLHRALTALHTRSRWRGAADQCGISLGILCGDLCLTWSDDMLHSCNVPLPRLRAAESLLDQMRTEVVLGQYLDLLDQATGGSLAGAWKIILLKTAKYTVERPLHLGGILADADPTLLDAYSAFGIPLGEAFQLRDDVLGVFGNTSVTGKSTVDDLREGKPTVLIALARQHATPADAARITALYGNPELDDRGAATLRQVIVATGARALVEDMIGERADRALRALDDAPVTNQARASLRQLAFAAVARHS